MHYLERNTLHANVGRIAAPVDNGPRYYDFGPELLK